MTIRNADNEKNDILITTIFYVGAIAKFYQFRSIFYSLQIILIACEGILRRYGQLSTVSVSNFVFISVQRNK